MWALTPTALFGCYVKPHSQAHQESNRYFSPSTKDSQEQNVPHNSQWQHHEPIKEEYHIYSPKGKSKHWYSLSLPYCHTLTPPSTPTYWNQNKRGDRRYHTVITPFKEWEQNIWEWGSSKMYVFCYTLHHPAGWLEPWIVFPKAENKVLFLFLSWKRGISCTNWSSKLK